MNDIFKALRDWLAAQTAISDLVETRVFVNRIPRDQIEAADTFAPPKMVVIRQAGGTGTSSLMDVDRPNIDVLCYGETDFEADKVRREVWSAFQKLQRVTQGGVLIHHVNPSGGPISSRDPDITWPIISQSFSTFAATVNN